MKIYLDNCCYNRPYDDQSQFLVYIEAQCKLRIQRMIREKELELASSYMLRYECSQNPYEMRKSAIMKFIDENASVYVSYARKDEIAVYIEY